MCPQPVTKLLRPVLRRSNPCLTKTKGAFHEHCQRSIQLSGSHIVGCRRLYDTILEIKGIRERSALFVLKKREAQRLSLLSDFRVLYAVGFEAPFAWNTTRT